MSWFNWVCPCAPARLVSMLPWGLLGAEGLHCLLSPPPRLQCWEGACSQLLAGAEDSRLFTGSLPGPGLTLHDPAWGACLLHLFVKADHPTSRNKDNQRKQARVGLLCSHVYSARTEGASALHCQYSKRLADQRALQPTLVLLAARSTTVTHLLLACSAVSSPFTTASLTLFFFPRGCRTVSAVLSPVRSSTRALHCCRYGLQRRHMISGSRAVPLSHSFIQHELWKPKSL